MLQAWVLNCSTVGIYCQAGPIPMVLCRLLEALGGVPGKVDAVVTINNAQGGIGRLRALCMLAGRSARQSTVRAAQLRLYERVYGVRSIRCQ